MSAPEWIYVERDCPTCGGTRCAHGGLDHDCEGCPPCPDCTDGKVRALVAVAAVSPADFDVTPEEYLADRWRRDSSECEECGGEGKCDPGGEFEAACRDCHEGRVLRVACSSLKPADAPDPKVDRAGIWNRAGVVTCRGPYRNAPKEWREAARRPCKMCRGGTRPVYVGTDNRRREVVCEPCNGSGYIGPPAEGVVLMLEVAP